MSAEKIIRTVFDITPAAESEWDYDCEKDPTVLKKVAIAEEFIKKHGLPKSLNDETKK